MSHSVVSLPCEACAGHIHPSLQQPHPPFLTFLCGSSGLPIIDHECLSGADLRMFCCLAEPRFVLWLTRSYLACSRVAAVMNKVAVRIPRFQLSWSCYPLLAQLLLCPWMLRQPKGLTRNFQESIYIILEMPSAVLLGDCGLQLWQLPTLTNILPSYGVFLLGLPTCSGPPVAGLLRQGACAHPQLSQASSRRHCPLGSTSMLLAGYAKNAGQSNVPQLPEKAVINNIF